MKRYFFIVVLIITTIAIYCDERGSEIAKKSFGLKKALDSYVGIEMILIDKDGNKRFRKLDSYTKETIEGTNTFIEFLEPADVSRVRFLTIARKKGDDEQRLYLPALGKVRRISSSNKDGKFMGSDLFYYDLEDQEYEDFIYKYIEDTSYNNIECHIIEMNPVDDDAPYSKQAAWISKKDFFIYKIECFDKKGTQSKIKTIVFMDIKNYNGVLIAERIVVDNHKENHKTLLQRRNIKISIGLKDDIFTVQNLTK